MNDTILELIKGEHDDVFTIEEKNKLIAELVKDTKYMRKFYGHNRQKVYYDKVA